MEDPDCPSPAQTSYWSARCGPVAKTSLLGVLVLGFLAQTLLVYADDSPSLGLEGAEVAGRRVWLEHNCQACHQLYGFGGFLGPDLTNAAGRLGRQQLADRLALGEGQMPKFDLPAQEIDDLWAFLQAMDRSGIGQARNPALLADASSGAGTLQMQAATALVEQAQDPQVAEGFRIFSTNTCTACHVLFGTSAIGAPDLSLTRGRLSDGEILAALEEGIAPTMPPSGLTEDQRLQVLAFLDHLGEHREEALDHMQAGGGGSFWSSLPWWEFE